MTTQQVPVVRRRVHTWEDPMATAAAAAEVDGLAFIRMLATGDVPPPPIATTLGFTVESVEHGRVVFGMQPAEFHFNPIGSVHGGVYATLLDSAMGCAVHSTLPVGGRYTSLDISVKFLRAIRTDSGPVRCEGVVVHRGGRTALAEARLLDGAERLCAHATSTCLLFRPEG
jgi:uncharacterized protein (TIGR00369 family)